MITLEEARQRVIAWNETARLPEMLAEHILANQIRVCDEEEKEFIQAKKEQNYLEILDGACDVLVTFSYMSYLINPKLYPQEQDLIYFAAIIEAENLLGVENTRLGLSAVLDSNDSKFQQFQTEQYHQQECIWIENNRPHSGAVQWHLKNGIVHYRDKNGTGKIMKPSTFKPVDLNVFINSNSNSKAH